MPATRSTHQVITATASNHVVFRALTFSLTPGVSPFVNSTPPLFERSPEAERPFEFQLHPRACRRCVNWAGSLEHSIAPLA